MNRYVQAGVDTNGQPKYKPAAAVWLRHRDRCQYIGGVRFSPGNNLGPHVLNTWRGFGCTPKPGGSWQLLKNHCFNVICNGDREQYDFLLGWLATMVQHPDKPGQSAVVIKGVEGCGKGILARAVMRMMRPHALTISNAKHLIGSFNGHLRDCVFLYADEAFFAGDKQHIGILKAIVTEEMIAIEGKYQTLDQARNYLHLLMTSNERWVVPAGIKARRFDCMECNDSRVGDFSYFAAIEAELNNGGHETMLYDLLHHDISKHQQRRVPQTEALQNQQKQSLDTEFAWWMECLHRGYVHQSKLGLEAHFSQWHDNVSTDLLYGSYEAFAHARHDRHSLSRENFGRFMAQVKAKPVRSRTVIIGEHITDVANPFGGTSRKAQLIEPSDRAHGYGLGKLDSARADFCEVTRLSVNWPAGEDVD